MNREEYRRQLAKWMAERKATERERIEEKPYSPGKMLVRAPWGCLVMAIAVVAGIIYLIGAAAGIWKN